MIDKTISALGYLALAVLIILIHEIGHYVVGWLIGIPRNRMVIKIKKMTPHIALVDDLGKKVSPVDLDEYVDLLEGYLHSSNKMFLYVVGGHAVELVMILTVVAIAFLSKANLIVSLAQSITWIAPLLSFNYLLMDIITTIRKRRPSGGDFSGLWEIAPHKAILFYLIYFISLAFAFVMVRTL